MADTKISALTALTGANVDTAADVLAIVDTSAAATKKILVDELRNAIGPALSTEQATTSGTAIDFTSIPAWVKKITVQFTAVSTSGSDNIIVQIGDSGGIEASGYLGSCAGLANGSAISAGNYTTGFGIRVASAGNVLHGTVVLTVEDSTNFTWVASGVLALSDSAAVQVTAGSKSLSAALDRVRITTLGGADTFDGGALNLLLE